MPRATAEEVENLHGPSKALSKRQKRAHLGRSCLSTSNQAQAEETLELCNKGHTELAAQRAWASEGWMTRLIIHPGMTEPVP